MEGQWEAEIAQKGVLMERVYQHNPNIDKSDWGPGPWHEEPDKIQLKDLETGYPCLILRNRFGALCGYVGVSKNHPAYEKGYDELNLDVHGGLTYSAHCQEGPEDQTICHIPDPGEPDDIWWLGFDCAHAFDLSPAMEAFNRRMYEKTGESIWATSITESVSDGEWKDVYRDISYVRGEIKNLARQLFFLENDPGSWKE